MGTQNSKERYISLWDILEAGITNHYNGIMRKFVEDYVERAPGSLQNFDSLYGSLKKLKQRKNSVRTVKPRTLEIMEEYCKFLSREKLYTQELLDDEYILIE